MVFYDYSSVGYTQLELDLMYEAYLKYKDNELRWSDNGNSSSATDIF